MGKTNAALPINTNANSVELTAAEVPTLFKKYVRDDECVMLQSCKIVYFD